MSFTETLRSIADVISAPTSNLAAAVLLLAVVVIIVLMAVIGLLILMTGPVKRRTRASSASAAVPPREVTAEEYEYPELTPPEISGKKTGKPPGRLTKMLASPVTGAIAAALTLVALVFAYASTSSDAYCAYTCHNKGRATLSRTKTVHRKVACVSCHETPGIGGTSAALTDRALHSISGAVRTPSYSGPVSSQSCIACHRARIAGLIVNEALGIRMSHKEPLAAGMDCSDCHPNVGHLESTATAGMSACIRCHDGKIAASECSSCHTGDTSRANRSTPFTERLFPNVILPPVRDCGGCHSQAKCDACHGLRLPHPIPFIKWEHARQGAFRGKKLCYRCHTENFCANGVCHSTFEPSHSATWRTEHAKLGTKLTCSCHYRKLPEQVKAKLKGDFCALCH